MQVKDLAHDLPTIVGLEQGEHVSKFVSGPIVEFDSCYRDRSFYVDTGDISPEVGCGPVRGVPFEQTLDRTSEKFITNISVYGRVFVKGGPHDVAVAGCSA